MLVLRTTVLRIAAVALATLGVAACATAGPTRDRPADAHLFGFWRVTSVHNQGGPLIHVGYVNPAYIHFSSDHHVVIFDGGMRVRRSYDAANGYVVFGPEYNYGPDAGGGLLDPRATIPVSYALTTLGEQAKIKYSVHGRELSLTTRQTGVRLIPTFPR